MTFLWARRWHGGRDTLWNSCHQSLRSSAGWVGSQPDKDGGRAKERRPQLMEVRVWCWGTWRRFKRKRIHPAGKPACSLVNLKYTPASAVLSVLSAGQQHIQMNMSPTDAAPILRWKVKGDITRMMATNVCCLSLKDPLLYQVRSFLVGCLLLILTGTYFNKQHCESVDRCHKLRCSDWRSWFSCRADADPYMNVFCCCWLWPGVSHSLCCLGLLCSAVLCVTVAARQVLPDEVSGA